MRLDLAVATRFHLSRRAAREAVRAGRVDVEGQTRDEPGLEVPEGVALSHDPDRPARRRVRTRLAVLHEDADLLVVEKPAGLLAVPTAEREKDTLLSRVSLYLQHRYRRRPYVGVVHRLDRDTSGAVVFARTREALHALQERFRRHDIEREYLAIVEGEPAPAGSIDAALAGDGIERRRGVARPGERGKRAVTRYRVLERLAGASLVAIELETGRTHQIRIHLAASGHPVLGDRVYRPPAAPPPPIEVGRQMLHARCLGFLHPRDGRPVRVEAAVPEDFARAVAQLRARARTKKSAPGSPGRGVTSKRAG
ncbi:MAG: RluA family pseudouridine synthase [Acidobacteriota bacterium]